MIGTQVVDNTHAIQPADKPTPKFLRNVESYMGLAIRRVMHEHHREEQR